MPGPGVDYHTAVVALGFIYAVPGTVYQFLAGHYWALSSQALLGTTGHYWELLEHKSPVSCEIAPPW